MENDLRVVRMLGVESYHCSWPFTVSRTLI